MHVAWFTLAIGHGMGLLTVYYPDLLTPSRGSSTLKSRLYVYLTFGSTPRNFFSER